MSCRSGCRTKDHESYGACLRDASPRVGWCNEAAKLDKTSAQKWDRELSDYRDCLRQGIEPEGTGRKDIDRAVRLSDKYGRAYDANKPDKNLVSHDGI